LRTSLRRGDEDARLRDEAFQLVHSPGKIALFPRIDDGLRRVGLTVKSAGSTISISLSGIRVEAGKGAKDRYVMLSPRLYRDRFEAPTGRSRR
jgi:hypothetical protein